MTAPRPDPERLLAEALRGHVGAPRFTRPGPDAGGSDPAPPARGLGRFTTLQLALVAAALGLVVGMAAGFVILVSR